MRRACWRDARAISVIAVASPVIDRAGRERFAAYIRMVRYAIGAYTFDPSGGAAALARLDERCR